MFSRLTLARHSGRVSWDVAYRLPMMVELVRNGSCDELGPGGGVVTHAVERTQVDPDGGSFRIVFRDQRCFAPIA